MTTPDETQDALILDTVERFLGSLSTTIPTPRRSLKK